MRFYSSYSYLMTFQQFIAMSQVAISILFSNCDDMGINIWRKFCFTVVKYGIPHVSYEWGYPKAVHNYHNLCCLICLC